MVARAGQHVQPINAHRGLQQDELRTRYRRFKHGDATSEIEEWLDAEQEDFYGHDAEWSDWSSEERHPTTLLNQMWVQLVSCLQGAGRFNPLPFTAPPIPQPPAAPQSASPRTIEVELLVWLDTLHEQPISALLPEPRELAALKEITSRHLDGEARLGCLLMLFSPFWYRPVHSFVPPQRGSMTAALVTHLIGQWPIPRFLLNAWREPAHWTNLRWLMLSVLLGRGGSIRRLTRTEHFKGGWHGGFRTAPSRLSLANIPQELPPLQGLMLAEIFRLGGDQRELSLLCRDRSYAIDPLSHTTTGDALRFWQDTVRWLISHREDISQFSILMGQTSRVLSWARHRFTEMQQGGPSFSWSGRTWSSATREADDYHQQVLDLGGPSRHWSARGWGWEDGDWVFVELCSTQALHQESLVMRHCVRMYDWKCQRGQAAIFRLTHNGKPTLTVELHPASRRIVQARGAYNRMPTAEERAVLRQWMRAVVSPDEE